MKGTTSRGRGVNTKVRVRKPRSEAINQRRQRFWFKFKQNSTSTRTRKHLNVGDLDLTAREFHQGVDKGRNADISWDIVKPNCATFRLRLSKRLRVSRSRALANIAHINQYPRKRTDQGSANVQH
jgi:hypothetical protein